LRKPTESRQDLKNEANFKAFLEVMDETQKKVLFQLIADSERHKATIEEIANNLGIEIEKKSAEFEFKDRRFFNEIYKLEVSVRSLYEQMIYKFGNLLGEEVEKLKALLNDEEKHAKLVEKFVDKTLRIV
jgi:N-acetyl-gamma-glutamylphosphate reductase